jgi:hypothetical protein
VRVVYDPNDFVEEEVEQETKETPQGQLITAQ